VTKGHGEQQVNGNNPHRRPDILRLHDIVPPYNSQSPRQDNAIPKFDLAEEILAEQRKIIAVKRKSPGRKIEALSTQQDAKSPDHTIEQPPHILSEQEQIITEIVDRDIREFCRRNP
jgi:hypothetical protein